MSTLRPKKFLGVFFLSCNTYGRLYINNDNTHYIGQCPKCGKILKVAIHKSGTQQRFFKAICR